MKAITHWWIHKCTFFSLFFTLDLCSALDNKVTHTSIVIDHSANQPLSLWKKLSKMLFCKPFMCISEKKGDWVWSPKWTYQWFSDSWQIWMAGSDTHLDVTISIFTQMLYNTFWMLFHTSLDLSASKIFSCKFCWVVVNCSAKCKLQHINFHLKLCK